MLGAILIGLIAAFGIGLMAGLGIWAVLSDTFYTH